MARRSIDQSSDKLRFTEDYRHRCCDCNEDKIVSRVLLPTVKDDKMNDDDAPFA